MEPTKVNINDEESSSYYLEYSDKLDFSPGVINMFGYARVSTQMQAQFGSSIDTQIQLLVDECQRYQYDENNKRVRYNLIRIYVDDGISGKNIVDRPGLTELQIYVNSLVSGRTHKKLGIIVSDLSRLTRSSSDLESFIKWITDECIKLKFIDSAIDATTDSGMLMLKMMASFFEFERKNSAFKTRLTLRAMSENGTLTGHCSYGWTTGVDENGRKIDVPVPEEQEGLNEVIRISRENPELTATQIKKIMNESGILCLRGPGRNFRGGKQTEKSIARNSLTEWTGKWTSQIIEKIIQRDRFQERLEKVKENEAVNIMKKDEIVIQLIKDYLEETDGYSKESFNYSEIARVIDAKNIFTKPLNRNYVKQMMLAARIIRPEPIKKEVVVSEEDVLETIRQLIIDENIITYKKLTEVLIEKQVPLIGKRKAWNATNVRDLCKKYDITI